MTCRPGLLLLVGAFLLYYGLQFGRASLIKGPPAGFVVARSGEAIVELGPGFCPEGVVQKNDALLNSGVTEMTCDSGARNALEKSLATRPLQAGESLAVTRQGPQQWQVERSWMAAARQMELGIPLQVDRLDYADWCDLPGVGPVLATAILADRQQNGDFGSLDQLMRVKGVGPGRIASWMKFF